MGKFRYTSQEPTVKKQADVHPIWRGIGCVMLVVVLVMSYAGSVLLFEANTKNRWVYPLPPIKFVSNASTALVWELGLALILAILGFVFLFIVYSIVYRFIGPPRYGPLDSPPPRRRGKPSKGR